MSPQLCVQGRKNKRRVWTQEMQGWQKAGSQARPACRGRMQTRWGRLRSGQAGGSCTHAVLMRAGMRRPTNSGWNSRPAQAAAAAQVAACGPADRRQAGSGGSSPCTDVPTSPPPILTLVVWGRVHIDAKQVLRRQRRGHARRRDVSRRQPAVLLDAAPRELRRRRRAAHCALRGRGTRAARGGWRSVFAGGDAVLKARPALPRPHTPAALSVPAPAAGARRPRATGATASRGPSGGW